MARDNADLAQLRSHPDNPQLTNVQPTTLQGCITALPLETIYHILRFVGPQDLIRLQTVSKFFRAIIQDPALWRTIYSTTRLPLPPGPFPWQSIRFLQRTLVHSARLANTWTTEPLTLISCKTYTGPPWIGDDRFQWVRGRWLIVSKGMKQLLSRDIETGSERVLWDHGSFAYWGATSVMIPQQYFIYVAVHLGSGRLEDPVKLLEFVVDDDTGYLSGPETFDVPTWSLPREAFTPRIRVDGGIAPYAYISLCSANKPRNSLVFDPRHRRFYKFPRFRTQLDILLNYRGRWLPHLVEVYFTRTHLFVLSRSYLIHGNLGEVEVVQTFALPDVDAPNLGLNDDPKVPDGVRPVVRELRLSHEMVTRDMGSMWLALIRDAIVDPVMQSTTLRFMHAYAPFYPTPDTHVRLVCTDYILPASHASPTPATAADDDDSNNNNNNNNHFFNLNDIVRSTEQVLPIVVASHDILSVQGVWKGNLVHVSNDGFVRGFCMVGRGSGRSAEMIHKFTVDATGERCVAIVGDPSPPCTGLDPSRHYEYSLDGMRGKIWYTKGGVPERDMAGQRVDWNVLAIVSDFK
ncbi:hypothetical protein J3R83DRAFT_11552 [Lanmaoa asiatica]|nr:hypothetical protein J3R83DRAFT_11552 [Lanmaoa asiatica]